MSIDDDDCSCVSGTSSPLFLAIGLIFLLVLCFVANLFLVLFELPLALVVVVAVVVVAVAVVVVVVLVMATFELVIDCANDAPDE